MPFTILFVREGTSQEDMKLIRDAGAKALSEATGIPEKNCHTEFLTSRFKGNNGPHSHLMFGVIISGFFKWWKIKQMLAATAAIKDAVFDVLGQSVEIFPLPLSAKATSRIKAD